MCGRARLQLAPTAYAKHAGVPSDAAWKDGDRYQPSPNAQPGAWLPILHLADQQQQQDKQQVVVQCARWGLMPSFLKPDAKQDHFKMFNARSETVGEKQSFSRLLPSRRCVVLLEGFYEWHKPEKGGRKQPYFVSLEGRAVMRLAGLWDVWNGPAGPLATFTLLTVEASPRLSWLHDRMPVLLMSDDAVDAWLGRGSVGGKQQAPLHLLGPCNDASLVWWPVTTAMSNPGYQRDDASADMRRAKGAITSFFSPNKKGGSSSSAGAGASSPQQPPQAAAAAAAIKREQQLSATPVKQEQLSKPVKQEQLSTPVKQEQQVAVKQEQQQPVKQEEMQPAAAVKQEPASDDAVCAAAAALNPDEQPGPSAADEAAAAQQVAAARKRGAPDDDDGAAAAAGNDDGVSLSKKARAV